MIRQTVSLAFMRMAVPKFPDRLPGSTPRYTVWAETHNPYYHPALDHDGTKLYGRTVISDLGGCGAKRS